ncbi:MAG: 8-oxoguanine deaminase [Betaproteobacteria bacterium]|nr:8-oxoguanine deaminase [Betaproteobacteria bacterium]
MRTLLCNASWIATCDDAQPWLERAHVSVVDGQIECVQTEPITLPAEQTVDLHGCLLMPGLINLHHHFFQTLTRAHPALHRAAAEDWLVELYPLWAELEPADFAAAARNTAAELLLCGTTTSVDHAFALGDRGDARIAAQIDTVRSLGLRQHLVRSCLPAIGGRVETRLSAIMRGRLTTLIDESAALLAQCAADLARWHDPRPGSMLQLALGPSNLPYTLPGLMRDLAALAAQHGCGLHAHYHPRDAERALCRKLNGQSPLAFLEAAGWLRPGTWLAHCTELDDEEITRFAACGVGVVHCPRTVLRLGYRIPRLARMRRAGVKLAFGADGSASNDGGAFISDIRLGMLLHRVDTSDDADTARDWLSPQDALVMATRGAAAMIGRSDIGMIAPGLCADLCAYDLSGLDCAGGLSDPLGAFLLAGSGTRARLTMVDGRIRVRDGRLVDKNEAAIAAETNARAARLLARARDAFSMTRR